MCMLQNEGEDRSDEIDSDRANVGDSRHGEQDERASGFCKACV